MKSRSVKSRGQNEKSGSMPKVYADEEVSWEHDDEDRRLSRSADHSDAVGKANRWRRSARLEATQASLSSLALRALTFRSLISLRSTAFL